MVSTQDSESCDPSSSLGGTFRFRTGARADRRVGAIAYWPGRAARPQPPP